MCFSPLANENSSCQQAPSPTRVANYQLGEFVCVLCVFRKQVRVKFVQFKFGKVSELVMLRSLA